MKSLSGLGPAPEPGSRKDSTLPAGVTTRRLSTKCLCGCRACVVATLRVAIQPPAWRTRMTAENGAASGRWASAGFPAPAIGAALYPFRLRSRVDLEHAPRFFRSMGPHAGRSAEARRRRPRSNRPPREWQRRSPNRTSQNGNDLALVARKATTSGGFAKSRENILALSKKDRP